MREALWRDQNSSLLQLDGQNLTALDFILTEQFASATRNRGAYQL
jgi:hypothetical protein